MSQVLDIHAQLIQDVADMEAAQQLILICSEIQGWKLPFPNQKSNKRL